MKEFYINDDNIRLHAKLDMPDGKEKCPLLILVHGLTGHMEEEHIVAVCDTMVNAGFAVLRAEMYGHGKSEGIFEEHTLFKWVSNIMTVTDYAKTLPFVTNLYLSGHSQGGLLTMLAAGMRQDDYKAIVPMSPALVIPDGAKKGNMLGITFDPEHIPDDLYYKDFHLRGNYFRCAQMIHPEDEIARYPKPVLLVHGDQDMAVPVQYSIDADRLYQNSRLVIIEGDDHNYHSHLDKVCEAVRAFLLKQENS